MALVFVLGLAATAAFVTFSTPRYTATATVVVSAQQIREDLVRTTIPDNALQRINSLISVILSRRQLVEIIEEFDPYPEMRDGFTLSEIATRLRNDIAIAFSKPAGNRREEAARVFSITVVANQSKLAADVANELATRFTEENIKIRNRQVDLATSFLRSQLEHTEGALREQNRVIRQFKEEHRGELPGELVTNLSKLDRLQQHRQSLALQITEAEMRLAMLTTPSDAAIQPTSAVDRLERLRADIEMLRGSLTEKHPDVVRLRKRIGELEIEVEQHPEAINSKSKLIVAANLTLDELHSQLLETTNLIVELDVSVSRTPANDETLAAFLEKEDVLRESYANSLRKVEEAELAQNLERAQQGERFSVLDRAVPPAGPNRSQIVSALYGVAASFALALGMGVLLELLGPVIITRKQLEQISGLPTLGTVPQMPEIASR